MEEQANEAELLRSILLQAQEMVDKGAVFNSLSLFTRLEKLTDEVILFIVDLHLKLFDFVQANRVLEKAQSSIHIENQKKKLKALMNSLEDKTRSSAVEWDTLVSSRLNSIKSFDESSWRVLLGNLYSRAFQLMIGSWRIRRDFYQSFQMEVLKFDRDTLLPAYPMNKAITDLNQLQLIAASALKLHNSFCNRLIGIFQYLDRYFLPSLNVDSLRTVCEWKFLNIYFKEAILPIIFANWVVSLDENPPSIPDGLSVFWNKYWSKEKFEKIKFAVRNRQKVITLGNMLPRELLSMVLVYLN